MSSINTRYTSPVDLIGPRRINDPRKTPPKGDNPLSAANPSTLRPTPMGKTKPHPDGITPNPQSVPGAAHGTGYTAAAGKAANADQPGGVTPNPHPIPGLKSGHAGAGANSPTGLNDQPGGVTPNPHPIPGLKSGHAGVGANGPTGLDDQPGGVTPNPHPIPGLKSGHAGAAATNPAAQGGEPDGVTPNPHPIPGLRPGTSFDPADKDARYAEKPGPRSNRDTGPAAVDADARAAAEGLVSTTFIEPILKQIREGNDAPPPFGPSRAEKQFGALLDTRLADEIAHATNFPIVQRIAEQLSRTEQTQQPATRIDLDA